MKRNFHKQSGMGLFLSLLLIIGFSYSLSGQVVINLTSSGQEGVSATWTNTSGSAVRVRITAQGGGGGKGFFNGTNRNGSTGTNLQGEFSIQPGETILAIAGGKGGDVTGGNGGGGGGAGSGAISLTSENLLLLASGGTGAYNSGPGLGGSAATNGNGSGGGAGVYSTGGGGLLGDGAASSSNNCPAVGGGQVSLTGISAGGSPCTTFTGGPGGSGMGGGGGASDLAGGGGGHTGGSGGNHLYGPYTSATSYNTGENQVNTNGSNNTTPNDGTVIVELLPEPPCPAPLTATAAKTEVSCNGGSDGTVTLSAGGANPPFSFTLGTTTNSTGEFSGLAAGTYGYTVTEGTCGTEVSGSITINEPSALALSETHGPIVCHGAATGTIDLSVSGGTPGYTYAWSNGAAGQDISSLAAGTYTVTVTDAHGCQATLPITIAEHAALTVEAGACKYVYYGYGSNCTTLSATAVGGGGTFTYAWSPGNLSGAAVNVCPTATRTYTVTVTDQYGCQATDVVRVEVIDVRCKGGKVQVCHGGITLCIAQKDVADHLAHGDVLGTCGTAPCGQSQNTTLGADQFTLQAPQVDDFSLEAYPNPASDVLNLKLHQFAAGDAHFEWLNGAGQVVRQERRALSDGYNEVQLSLNGLPPGLYLLRVSDSAHRQLTARITKAY